ncbi:MAG: hypothetical protein KGI58_00880 [Patescibacteria group bacterium]|nr:hypothetical protein [Patescibacteria group bacterium]
MKKIKVYISTCFKNAGSNYCQAMMSLQDKLKGVMHGVEFIEQKIPKGVQNIFEYKKRINRSVYIADLIILEASMCSTELKNEIYIAVEKYGRKVLVLCKSNEAQALRFRIWTDLNNNPKYTFKTYSTNTELIDICERAIAEAQQTHNELN